jgi:hypothetical protein
MQRPTAGVVPRWCGASPHQRPLPGSSLPHGKLLWWSCCLEVLRLCLCSIWWSMIGPTYFLNRDGNGYPLYCYGSCCTAATSLLLPRCVPALPCCLTPHLASPLCHLGCPSANHIGVAWGGYRTSTLGCLPRP